MEVFRRDNHTCRYCGEHSPDVVITIDHVVPISLGGRDEPENLVAACRDCNAGKSSIGPGSSLVEDVRADALRWGRALSYVIESRRQSREELNEDLDEFSRVWEGWKAGNSVVPRDERWRESVKGWMKAGVELDELISLVDVAMRSQASFHAKWKYFCGCAWKSVEEIRDEARELWEETTKYEEKLAAEAPCTCLDSV
jgi:hypothetical protein